MNEIQEEDRNRESINLRSAIENFYQEISVGRCWQLVYENSGWMNLGYWDGEVSDLPEACKALCEHLLARSTGALGRVLDVACGLGATSDTIWRSNRVSSVCGINISHAQLKLASARASNASFLCMDAAQLGFGDATFDTVFCCEAAFHFRTRRQFLQEAARVLVPGGQLIISDSLIRAGSRSIPSENIVRTTEDYLALLEQCGFSEVSLEVATDRTWAPYARYIARWLMMNYRNGKISRSEAAQLFQAVVGVNDGVWGDYLIVRAGKAE